MLQKRTNQLDRKMDIIKGKVEKNLKSNIYDIYEGFVRITADETTQPRVRGRHSKKRGPDMKCEISFI